MTAGGCRTVGQTVIQPRAVIRFFWVFGVSPGDFGITAHRIIERQLLHVRCLPNTPDYTR